MKRQIVVTTFNLLAQSTFAGEGCDGELRCEVRYPLLFRSLRELTSQQHIVVLQEVDKYIESALYGFLLAEGYVYVPAKQLGPRRHATAIGVPASLYHMQEMGYERIGDSIRKPSLQAGLKTYNEARWRTHVIPWVVLYDWYDKVYFVVFGLHMPCAVRKPLVMAVQLYTLLQRTRELARGLPFLVAGDFNMLPTSPLYDLVVSGNTAILELLFLTDQVLPLVDPAGQSNFVTNKTKDFEGRIDYVFTSDLRWRLNQLHVGPIDRPLPDSKHGSDHVPVTYNFFLT